MHSVVKCRALTAILVISQPLAAQRASSTLPLRSIDVSYGDSLLKLPPPTVSPEALVRALTTRPKSEYETTAAYTERVLQKIVGGHYAMRIPVVRDRLKDCGAEVSYDADAGMLTIKLPNDQDALLDSTTASILSGVEVSCRESRIGTYQGTNAFGVTKQIARVHRELITVEVSDSAFDSLVQFPLAVEAARRHKPNIGILVIVTPGLLPGDGIIHVFDSRYKPEISSPVDLTVHNTFIGTVGVRFVVYDTKTAEILYHRSGGSQ